MMFTIQQNFLRLLQVLFPVQIKIQSGIQGDVLWGAGVGGHMCWQWANLHVVQIQTGRSEWKAECRAH